MFKCFDGGCNDIKEYNILSELLRDFLNSKVKR